MDLGKLAKGLLGSDAGKKIAKEATKAVTSKVTKTVTKSSSALDLGSLVSLATGNSEVVGLLGKLGALKGIVEPEESKAQAIVKKVFTLVKKATGLKGIDEATFSKIVTKILSSSTVKAKIEELAGKTGSLAFIKKAIAVFVG